MLNHQWEREPSGEVARTTYHSVVRIWHRHKGPRCAVCEYLFCESCYPEGWHRVCPGPPPEGARWDWADGSGNAPPIEPELRSESVWE